MNSNEKLVVAAVAILAIYFGIRAALMFVPAMFSKASDKTVSDTVSLKAFDSIKTDVASVNTYIERGDSYSLEYHVREDYVPEISEENGKLTVKQPSVFNIGIINPFDNEEQYYKITVPEDADILEANLNSSSGTLRVDCVDIAGKVDISSGDVELVDIRSKELDLHATSGSMKLSNVSMDTTTVNLTSGRVVLDDCTTDEIKVDLTSGHFECRDFEFSKGDFEATSGTIDIEAKGNEDDYSYDMKASSGSIRIGDLKVDDSYKTDSDKEKEIRCRVHSGTFKISFTD